jgi:hypothetical protein
MSSEAIFSRSEEHDSGTLFELHVFTVFSLDWHWIGPTDSYGFKVPCGVGGWEMSHDCVEPVLSSFLYCNKKYGRGGIIFQPALVYIHKLLSKRMENPLLFVCTDKNFLSDAQPFNYRGILNFCNTRRSINYSQRLVTGPYPEPDESSSVQSPSPYLICDPKLCYLQFSNNKLYQFLICLMRATCLAQFTAFEFFMFIIFWKEKIFHLEPELG